MAQIVLGIGTSHSPQLGVPGRQWDVMQKKDENDPRIPYQQLLARGLALENDLRPDRMQERDDACQRAIGVLGDVMREVKPDIMVVFGDDQHEQFLDDNMPMLCVYRGETLPLRKRTAGTGDSGMFGNATAWRAIENARDGIGDRTEFPAHPELANHLIASLCDGGFDVARANTLREDVGIGHAFSFVYRRIAPEGTIPMVPFMVNTYYPPNTPTPKRCYTLGQSVRQAIEAWDSDLRVAVVASGGLSHVIIDEEIDKKTIDGLLEKDPEALCALKPEDLVLGTSEIRNWIILGGALEHRDMTLVDYIPTYRSPAGTGCGMTFAYWK